MRAIGGGVETVDGGLVALDQLGGNRILQVLLDLTAQITGAVGLGIGLFDQVVQQNVVPGEGNTLFRQGGFQLVQHDGSDGFKVVLAETVEVNDLIDPVDEFRPQETLQRLHGPLTALLARSAAEAHAAGGIGAAARIGGHDDDGVLEVHIAALGVGNVTVIQDLKQDVQHIRMGLLDLVEEDDAVGLAPDSVIFLISHRLYLFSETDGVIWMDNGTAEFSSHKKLLKDNSAYRELYQLQTDYSVAKPTESAIERGIC